MVGWMVGWMNGWMDGWLDGWMDGWMDEGNNNLLCQLLIPLPCPGARHRFAVRAPQPLCQEQTLASLLTPHFGRRGGNTQSPFFISKGFQVLPLQRVACALGLGTAAEDRICYRIASLVPTEYSGEPRPSGAHTAPSPLLRARNSRWLAQKDRPCHR